MSYASATSIITNNQDLPQTTTEAGYAATMAIIDAHISRVDALINAKIARRYSVPVSPTPPLIANIAEDITSFYTYRTLYAKDNQNTANRLEDYLTPEAQSAFALLDDIRKGSLDLVDTAGSLIAESGAVVDDYIIGLNEDYHTTFDMDGPLDWKIDSDRLDSIRDGRR